ncbi:Formin-like protein [Cocos nucifera]|uniref:Formin-like protein n=1 Tax=Cocos nucifera TaxID=13894 RepID=A0A8K0IBN5_COCNU|nr:Formin-like protein [Cocos nucifera]
MNDGTYRGGAQAFKLDTLLKLADVKGTDGKTTLLHFVVQEIIRSEGVRAVRLAREQSGSISSVNLDDFIDDANQDSEDHFRKLGLKVVSGLGEELENVKKAAGLDADALTSTVASLGHKLLKTKEFLNACMKSMEEESGFHRSLKYFVEQAEADVTFLLEEEKRIRLLVKSTVDYFHGSAGKDEGLRLFVIVRDFLGMVDKACKEVRELPKKVTKTPIKETATSSPVRDPRPDPRQLLFPAIKDRRVDSSSSDDES